MGHVLNSNLPCLQFANELWALVCDVHTVCCDESYSSGDMERGALRGLQAVHPA